MTASLKINHLRFLYPLNCESWVRRQEVPVGDGAADCFLFGVIGEYRGLRIRIHTTVHTANALHQADRIPMYVIVNQARGVLQVQAFGEDICGDEDASFGESVGFERLARRTV